MKGTERRILGLSILLFCLIWSGSAAWAGGPARHSALARRGPLPLGASLATLLRQQAAPRLAAEHGTPPADTNVRVNQDVGNEPQNETTLAVNPLNDLHLVGGANDYRIGDGDASCGFYTSFDAGRTWTDGLISRAGYDGAGDPSVAIGPDGTVYFACLHIVRDSQGNPQENKLSVSRSLTGGVSFEPPRTVALGANENDFHDKPYIAVDQTHGPFSASVYLCWTHFDISASAILFSRSVDGGQTWSAPLQVSTPSGLFGLNSFTQGCSPAVGPDGSVYVAWEDFDFPDRLVIARSVDGGKTFGVNHTVANITPIDDPLNGFGWQFRTNSFPSLGVAPDSTLYVAWADQGTGDADIRVSRSIDGGTSWSAPVRVNDDGLKDGRHQFFPWLAVDPSGAVHVMFYDNRLGTGALFDVFYTRSTDKGVTWLPNQRVTGVGSSPNTPGFGGTFIGDYNALAVSEFAVHPFWTDDRSGLQDLDTDRLAPRAGLSLGLGVSRAVVPAGTPVTLSFGAIYPPGAPLVSGDLFVGFVRPDGVSLLFLKDATGATVPGTLADLTSFVPIASGLLAGGIDAVLPNLFTLSFGGGEPPGTHLAFFLITQAGALKQGAVAASAILGLAVKAFVTQ